LERKSKRDHPENILITSSNFPRGSAAANYLNLFCRGIVKSGSGIEVFILKGYFLKGRKTSDTKINTTEYGVNYKYLAFVNRSSNGLLKIIGDIYGLFSLICLLLSLFGKRKKTTVFCYNNEIHHSLLTNIYCRLTGIKIITFVPEYYDISEFSGNFLHKLRWYGFLLNFHYVNRLSDKLIVFSKYIKSKYVEKKYPEKDILVQPNLTDFEFWNKDNVDHSYTIGYSGTPYKKDGIEDLLSAVGLLAGKNIEARVVIIGDVVNEKSIIPSLTEFCNTIGISRLVTFTGHVPIDDVKEWLNKCQILAITRPNIVQTVAGFPTKIGEYFACRKTVLSTRIGDVCDYFVDRKEIVFAESDNPRSIADNIEWILNNKEASRDIAANGFNKARGLLDYTIKVPEMMTFVKSES
jgi:glycosyltransferase involved in cell wall biosynthesis